MNSQPEPLTTNPLPRDLKVALVHDWLTGMRGGERVLEALCELYPKAPIYTLFHFPGSTSETIESHEIHASFLNKLPFVKKYYRYTYTLMPIAIETFDLSGYDLVISSTSRVAKGVLIAPHTCHISYVHSPMRETWEMYHEYFGPEQMSWWKRIVIPPQISFIRLWDQISSARIDYAVANAENVRKRIRRAWQKDATVIHPPVNTALYSANAKQRMKNGEEKEDYYLMVGSFEPNKRVPLAIDAFNKLGYPLKIVSGTGRGHEKILKDAKDNIEFLGWRDDEAVAELYAKAKGFVFPGVDDFGITPLEAQASGTPVIAYGEGGALETVIDGITGVFFSEPTGDSLAEAVRRAEAIDWDTQALADNAKKFSKERFKNEMKAFIEKKYKEYRN